jgi:hypothetical protein
MGMMAGKFALVLVLLFSGSTLAMSEVADKQPSPEIFWVYALVVACLSWGAAMLRWWLPLVVAAFAALASYGILVELNDPTLSPAIWKELGPGYVAQSYLCGSGAVMVPVIVAAWRRLAMRSREAN